MKSDTFASKVNKVYDDDDDDDDDAIVSADM